ncbi:glycosyltransferase [Lichenicola cladoniae]|uniref:Glycosyltransferase n=1 Tax=Lichenicola cladoniae TaxID=1484109 RepID=A0A6M8HQ11_9PROT|nr:glycosyltransferase [Lichenicola cladoniae]NPD66405.1 glycosyltransferase [Acetobacteraceae bacterium]QKE90355.1 glycosyltransferase [Lichenicola cladoniae]
MLTRLIDSLETIRTVSHLYRVLLQRPPDGPGLAHNAGLLDAGVEASELIGAMLASGEAQHLWAGQGTVDIARSIWDCGQPSLRGFARRRDARCFAKVWNEASGIVQFIIEAVQSDRARSVPILPLLFPNGIDPDDRADTPAWAYPLWAEESERAIEAGLASLLPRLLRSRKRIDLVLELDPGGTTPDLVATINSLRAQVYPHWRLLLSGSPAPGQGVPVDPRIVRSDERSVGDLADWIGWLRPGDTLAPTALALFALTIRKRHGAVAIYCDEDCRQPDGLQPRPVLKAGWDPDAAERIDVMGALALYRASHLYREPRTPFDAGGPIARCRIATRDARDRQVVHLPAILCHRIETPAATLPVAPRDPDRPRPTVSVVIATRDLASRLACCVNSLRRCTDYPNVQIVLVDNGSSEPDAIALLDRLAGEAGCLLLRRPGAFNWSALNNEGVRASSGDIVVLLNNDVECIEPGWLDAMVFACLQPQVGVVGALLLFPRGEVQHAGIVIGPGPVAAHAWSTGHGHHADRQNFSAVTGACMAFRRSVFDGLNGLNAAQLPVTWNDVDFCLRAREAGLRVVLARQAVLVHDEGSTRTPDSAPENLPQLLRTSAYIATRHRHALTADPFLNPNLTVKSGGRLLDPSAPQQIWPILQRGGR